jgi:DNA repair exonuclease SbcCD ATPase subunit
MGNNKFAKIALATITAGTLVAAIVVPAFAESTESTSRKESSKNVPPSLENKNLPVFKDKFATRSQEVREKLSSRSGELKERFGSRSGELRDKFGSKSGDIKNKLEEKCQQITQRIETIEDKYTTNKESKINQFNKIKTRVQELITKLKSKGYDTTKLETDLKTLETKIQKLATDYDTFIKSIQNSSQFTCGSSQGEFISAFQKAKNSFNPLKQDTEDIRKFNQTVLKADIEAVRKFIKSQKEASRSGEQQRTPKPTTLKTASPSAQQ